MNILLTSKDILLYKIKCLNFMIWFKIQLKMNELHYISDFKKNDWLDHGQRFDKV